jgi:hypothetical protein
MPVSYLVGSSVVCLSRGTRFSPVFGSNLFTDCSLRAARALCPAADALVTRTFASAATESPPQQHRDPESEFRENRPGLNICGSQLKNPTAVTVDEKGAIYIAEVNGANVRKLVKAK